MTKRLKATARVFLHDEVPSVGSGWRGIVVKKLGRKWAHLTDVGTRTNFRMALKKWTELHDASNRRLPWQPSRARSFKS